ncbi:hypothetical protein [Bradyrhizobium sp. Ghvi]|uniref:hypothetical protein n=1 Tax=Bradyrhizobium sp. Ghvi TaxID=1855319 RepID=UPI001FCD79CB|nr:hypothetical protein [Bradyrhizobium sp. Ghvi]
MIEFLAHRFDINGIRNLMALPATQGLAVDLKSSPHAGGHLGSYYAGFKEYLNAIKDSDEFRAGIAGRERQVDKVVSDLNRLLAAAKYAQANGHLFPTTPNGMTPEQANDANKNWFENWRKYSEDNEDQIREMLDTINQLSASGQWNGALHWPILSPNSTLGLKERIEILNQFLKDSPFSRQFTAIGPVPALPGLVPSFVNTQLPGFIPVSPDDVKQPEGFTPSNPALTYGLRGFPAATSDWQRFGQQPPSTAAPSIPQVLQFNPETGQQMFMSDGSPMLGPSPYNVPDDPRVLLGLGISAAALAAPALLPSLPAWVWTLGALGSAGAMAGSTANATPSNHSSGGVFATGAPPYDPFSTGVASNYTSNGSPLLGTQSGAQPRTDNALDQEPARSSTFDDRFGTWPGSAAAAPQSQPLNKPEAPTVTADGVAAPVDVRRLTRVNATNAGSVFESGSAPVPYLPPPEFDARFGNWREQGRHPQLVSSPLSAFADEPGYAIPPPIWGLGAASNQRNDAEEWFSRWIQPLLDQDQR